MFPYSSITPENGKFKRGKYARLLFVRLFERRKADGFFSGFSLLFAVMLCAEKLEIGCGEHHASAFEDSAFAEDIQHGAAHGVVGRIGERISIHAAEKEEESISAVSDFMRIEVSFAEECRNVGFGKAFFPLRVENPGVAGKQPDFLMEKGPEKGEGLVERVAQAFGSHAATAGDVDFENRLPTGR